jgi:hypothetical protein
VLFVQKVEAMSRGSVIIDENVSYLQAELGKRNIRAITPLTGMTDEQIAEKMAMHKILITNNSKDFLQYAIEYEIGLIAVEKLSKDPATLASIISATITSLSLWSKHKPFLVTFKDNKPQFEQLTEA